MSERSKLIQVAEDVSYGDGGFQVAAVAQQLFSAFLVERLGYFERTMEDLKLTNSTPKLRIVDICTC